MYVCLSVMGLRLKYTGLCIVYVPLWHVLFTMPSRWRLRSRTRRIEDDARTSPDVWKTVNCSTKTTMTRNEHPSYLLRSLTCERDRRRSTRRHLDSALSFAISSDRTFNVLCVRQMVRMRIPSLDSSRGCPYREVPLFHRWSRTLQLQRPASTFHLIFSISPHILEHKFIYSQGKTLLNSLIIYLTVSVFCE